MFSFIHSFILFTNFTAIWLILQRQKLVLWFCLLGNNNDDLQIFQSFAARPFVFVSAKYTRATKPSDAVYVWLENVSSRGFEVCIREFSPFDGKHQDTILVGVYT